MNKIVLLSHKKMIIFNYPCCVVLQQARIIMLNLYNNLGREALCVLQELFVISKMH